MNPALTDSALDQLFRIARSFNKFSGRAIDDATLEQLYELELGYNAAIEPRLRGLLIAGEMGDPSRVNAGR
jgi:hypothetical protein